MTPRPGPLCELPLERFVDVPLTPVPATPQRKHKRPLSPGTPNLFSPTKRRILTQEGVFSPEKTIKRSFVSSDRDLAIHDVLMQSPARKLDFGQPSRGDAKVTSTSRLLQNCFQEPTPKHSRSLRRHDRDRSSLPIPSAFSSQLLSVPSSSNPPRCPDFDVIMDCDPDPSSLAGHPSSNYPRDSDEDKESSQDEKENVRPKTRLRNGLPKRAKKVSFAPPDQPRRPNTPKVPFTPLNTRGTFAAHLSSGLTPNLKGLKVGKEEIKRRRMLLAMELDGDDDSDNDF